MIVHHHKIPLQSELRVTFHDVTDAVKQAVADAKVTRGIATVYSQHTTCSVMLQEASHDTTLEGTEYLLQDMLDLFEQLIPKCQRERQYLHPGPEHLKHATENLGEEAFWSLNTDAHLRSALIGRSETIPVADGQLELGEFGQVYFVDFDTVRARQRVAQVQVMGA